MGEPTRKATAVIWYDVTEKLPHACCEILAEIDGKVRQYYVSTHPRECVEDDRITRWAVMPKPTDQQVTVSHRTILNAILEGLSKNGWKILGKEAPWVNVTKPVGKYLATKGVRMTS